MTIHDKLSRRSMLQGAAGLVIGFYLPRVAHAQSGAAQVFRAGRRRRRRSRRMRSCASAPTTRSPCCASTSRWGRGRITGLTTIVAEELDADWTQMRVESAPPNREALQQSRVRPGAGHRRLDRHRQFLRADSQGRRHGARAARAGGGRAWNVPAGEITVERGVLRHAGSGTRRALRAVCRSSLEAARARECAAQGSGELQADRPRGRGEEARCAGKTNGTAQFTIDVREPGMLTVVVAHPPRFGGKVASFDAAEARKIPGVVDVKQVPAALLSMPTACGRR